MNAEHADLIPMRQAKVVVAFGNSHPLSLQIRRIRIHPREILAGLQYSTRLHGRLSLNWKHARSFSHFGSLCAS